MNTLMMRKFTDSRISSIKHPVLSAGNILEGLIGIGATASAIYSILLYGISLALVFNLIYIIIVTILALMSAYHLM